jgi:pimeloyl-ACP methyl ester carboxylesterase
MQVIENLVFEQFGEQHSGCPLLILHGFFASSRNWRAIAKRLANHRRVYVLDMRNHGGSPHNPLMDYPNMAADVLAFMDKQHVSKADLLGHSMGGKIAMWFALHYPQRLGALIVVDIAPVSYQHSFDPTIQALRDLPLNNFSNRKQMEEWLAPAIADLNYRQFLLQNLLFVDGAYHWRVNLDYFQDNAPNIVAFPPVPANAFYPNPALFLAGEHSRYIQPEAVLPLFPAAKIIEMAGCGHWLHVDAPQLFIEQVENWLKD